MGSFLSTGSPSPASTSTVSPSQAAADSPAAVCNCHVFVSHAEEQRRGIVSHPVEDLTEFYDDALLADHGEVCSKLGRASGSGNKGQPHSPYHPMARGTTRHVEQKVDVFLCHAGEQKRTIVSHLDSALRRAGFTVFLDVKNMVMGQTADQTIYPALTSAWAVVVVMSLDFVGKHYPLKELRWAMQHKDRIVPIFFNITRKACSKLLNADAPDAERLADKEVKCILDKVVAYAQNTGELQAWKEVLVEFAKVGNIDPKDPSVPLTEAELVDRVVQEVVKMTGQPLSMPQYPVELDGGNGRVGELAQHLSQGGKLGLFGEGGIGKTTLAKAIFNELAAQLRCDHAFCEVGMEHESKDLLDRANSILKQLSRPPRHALDQLHKGLLKGRTVLLLLDNLWHQYQIKDLVEPLLSGIAAGSIIICTSRSQDLLSSIKDLDCQEVHSLEHVAAKRLLYWHAFGSDDADLPLPPAVQPWQARLLEVCAGVPLALEVAGSVIYKMQDQKFEVKTWQHAIACLAGPKDGVMERILNMSLGSLGENPAAVHMFYDVACFLRGKFKHEAEAAWLGIYDDENTAQVALQELLSLNLCKVDSENRLTMHDLLWNLGRKRTLQLSDGQWKNQKWLWGCDEAFNIIKKSKVSEEVRTLQLRQHSLAEVKVPSWKNLYFLEIEYCSQCWTMDLFPDELVWLECRAVDWVRLPDIIPCKELRIMHLQACRLLNSLPEGISCLTALQTLTMSGCGHRSGLPEGISCLTALQTLDLSDCIYLRILPEGISCLTALQMLRLSKCSQLSSLPEGIRCLTALQTLRLLLCAQLSSLPEGVSCLTALQTLHLTGCNQLSSLPEGVSCLTTLQTLYLPWCKQLSSLPEGVSCLTTLQTLHLSWCQQLSSLPQGVSCLTALQTLNLLYCHDLSSLPEGVSCLTMLQTLYLSGCQQLSSLPEGVSCLTALQVLHLSWCQQLSSLPEGISCLTGLRELDLSECGQLSSLPKGISCLTALHKLRVSECYQLRSLPKGASCLTALKMLDLLKCSQLSSLPTGLGFGGQGHEARDVADWWKETGRDILQFMSQSGP